MSADPFSQLLGREQAIWLNHGLLRMDPLGFDGVEPWSLGGQEDGQNAHAFARLFDLLVVLPDPTAHQFTAVPGGIIPNQEPVPLADAAAKRSQHYSRN